MEKGVSWRGRRPSGSDPVCACHQTRRAVRKELSVWRGNIREESPSKAGQPALAGAKSTAQTPQIGRRERKRKIVFPSQAPCQYSCQTTHRTRQVRLAVPCACTSGSCSPWLLHTCLHSTTVTAKDAENGIKSEDPRDGHTRRCSFVSWSGRGTYIRTPSARQEHSFSRQETRTEIQTIELLHATTRMQSECLTQGGVQPVHRARRQELY